MPSLADTYAGADSAVLAAADLQYRALNDFAGGVGELLGVSLFAAAWLALTIGAAWRSSPAPRWLLAAGAVVALLVATPLVELAGVDSGALISVGSGSLNTWFLMVAIVAFRASSSEQR